ncbi:hypothetical protein [Acinetobacter baumannii]|uniref:hypothetical protein n=1 Tax=Acinetobacter baumannii TaxID=470 RepID=UPI0031DEB7F3
MGTKYDWSNVPADVNWVAKDHDGRFYGFDHQPKPWALGFLRQDGFKRSLYFPTVNISWQDSLEQRPVEKN